MAVRKINKSIVTPSPSEYPQVTPPNVNWKDHPLAVGAICVAATIGLSVLVVNEIILPTYKERLVNQLAELPEVRKAKSQADAHIINLEKEIEILKIDLLAARNTNLFSIDNPYPTGLRTIKIGDSITELSKYFSDSKIDKEESYWSITLENSPITHVTYYFGRKSNPNIIHMIGIYFNNFTDKRSRDLLKNLLIEALGAPNSTTKSDDEVIWILNSNLEISLSENLAQYTISDI
jgi:hypothetical protein